MIQGRVRCEDGAAVKLLGALPSTEGRRLAALSHHLCAAGVRTPPASYLPAEHALRMPRAAGEGGRERLARWLAAGAGGRPDCDRDLTVALRPLVRLHALRAADLGLARFDPWSKVLPRLADGTALPAVLREEARAVVADVRALARCVEDPGEHVVHGDFHAGQLVFDDAEEAWLLDLDDLAAGHPEADLGNFAAHVATQPNRGESCTAAGFAEWAQRLAEACVAAGGARPDRARLAAHGAAALLRRALKLWQRDADERRCRRTVAAAAEVAVRVL